MTVTGSIQIIMWSAGSAACCVAVAALAGRVDLEDFLLSLVHVRSSGVLACVASHGVGQGVLRQVARSLLLVLQRL